MDKGYWCVKAGRGGKYAERFHKGNYIAIGWVDIDDFSKAHNVEELRDIYQRIYPEDPPGAVITNSGQLWRFLDELHVGDLVATPDPFQRKALFGEVTGDYKHVPDPRDGCPYPHRRTVRWIRHEQRNTLPPALKKALGVQLTVYSLAKYAEEIDEVLIGILPSPKSFHRDDLRFYKEVIKRVRNLSAREFEELVANVLMKGMGFQDVQLTPFAKDRGIDITAIQDIGGLVQLNLKVQVKRWTNNVGIRELQMFRGALGSNDQGAIVATSGFTKAAIEAAEEEGKPRIGLIAGEDLVDLIVEHYDSLDERFKKVLKLRSTVVT
jgi:restriction system protein